MSALPQIGIFHNFLFLFGCSNDIETTENNLLSSKGHAKLKKSI